MTYAMKLAAPLLLATLTSAQVAQAGSATGTMNVSGNVQGSCTVSAVALNFGSITPGSATDAEGSIGAACTTGVWLKPRVKTIWSISSPLMNPVQLIATSQQMAPWSATLSLKAARP